MSDKQSFDVMKPEFYGTREELEELSPQRVYAYGFLLIFALFALTGIGFAHIHLTTPAQPLIVPPSSVAPMSEGGRP